MHYFEKLNIWKKAMDLCERVYRETIDFPKEEKYGLTSQIRRCAVSIPSNIAEGAGRNSNPQFQHFLSIANGSTCELITQLHLSYRLGLLNESVKTALVKVCVEISNMNYGLQKSLNKTTSN